MLIQVTGRQVTSYKFRIYVCKSITCNLKLVNLKQKKQISCDSITTYLFFLYLANDRNKHDLSAIIFGITKLKS